MTVLQTMENRVRVYLIMGRTGQNKPWNLFPPMSVVEGIKSVPSVCERSHRRTHTVGIDFIHLTTDNGRNKISKIKYIVACQGLQGLQRTTAWAHTSGG